MNRVFHFLGIIIALFCFGNRIASAQTTSSECTTEVDSILNKLIYLSVDKTPELFEKFSAFQVDIFKQIKPSEFYSEHGGRIVIAFVLETDGSIKGIRVVRDKTNTNHFFSDQIVNALKKYKRKWKPGSCNGIPVPVLFTLPFNIGLQE